MPQAPIGRVVAERADVLAEQGDWPAADHEYDAIKDIDPGNVPVQISRCDWLLKLVAITLIVGLWR